MNKIYADTTHPMSNLIKRKTTRCLRVLMLTQMPKGRTEKLEKKTFSSVFLISKCFDNLIIY